MSDPTTRELEAALGEPPDHTDPQADELLTARERELIEEIGNLMSGFTAIVSDDKTRRNDMFEVMLHVHALQNMVLAQAAGRAYPEHYRLLGEAFGPDDPPTEGRHADA